MNDDFIKMINDIDFLYGFIYECTNLINNLFTVYTKDRYSICSYLMNICCEGYFKLSQDEYLEKINYI